MVVVSDARIWNHVGIELSIQKFQYTHLGFIL